MNKLSLATLIIFMGLFFNANAAPESCHNENQSLFPEYSRTLGTSHFSWGAEIGSSIDLTANNLSTFDADVTIGYKNKFLKMAGVGIGIHKAFGSGNNFIPIYAVIRTPFRRKPSPFFFNITAGYSFNTIGDSAAKGGFNMSVGIGVDLAVAKLFHSHLILSYGYLHLNDRQFSDKLISNKNISLARLTIGVNF